MALVTVDHAESGMVLSANVLDRRGRLLIPSGRALTEKHVSALRMWGVPHIEVHGGPDRNGPDEEVPPEIMARALEEVEVLFRNAGGDHPFLDALKRVSAQKKARTLSSHAQAEVV